MKKVILLRHAKTEPYDYNKDDFQRNLTPRGIKDSHIICDVLKGKGYEIQHIVCSPANRAAQTSELFAQNFNLAKSTISFYPQIYDGVTTQELLNLLRREGKQYETLLFVGHNPDISRFAYRLTRSFEHYVPTCCAIVLETDIATWDKLGEQEFVFKDIFIPKNYKITF